jgi:hypothetical protein
MRSYRYHSVTPRNIYRKKPLQNANFGELEGRSHLPNAHLAHFMSDLDALVEGFAQGMSSQESSGKRVSGSIGVNDLVVGQFRHGVGLGVRFFGMNVALRQRRRRRRNERGFGTLSDDNEARTGGVGFGQVGNRARDLSDARVLLRRGTFSEKL